jgi:hypothetical protein
MKNIKLSWLLIFNVAEIIGYILIHLLKEYKNLRRMKKFIDFMKD